MIDTVQLTEQLQVAINAAQASSHILKASDRLDPISQRGEDIKLQEDKLSEAAIVAFLQQNSSIPILSEEAGWLGSEPGSDDLYWVMDPLDGSFNFNRGVPLCCTSVALARGNQPLVGAIFDFNRDELFAGGVGIPLTLNGEPVPPHPLKRQIISSGYPVGRAQDEAASGAHREALEGWPKKRMIGSAALSLAWVAAGRFDSYFEPGIRWWDVAAGLALVTAAGGSVKITGDDWNLPLDVHAEVV